MRALNCLAARGGGLALIGWDGVRAGVDWLARARVGVDSLGWREGWRCQPHQCCHHPHLTLDAPLFCRGPCQSSAGVRFIKPCGGVIGLKWQTKYEIPGGIFFHLPDYYKLPTTSFVGNFPGNSFAELFAIILLKVEISKISHFL